MSESEEGRLELTALGYIARQIPILGPILMMGDERRGEHYWHSEQKKETRQASKKFRKTARIAVPAALAALVALNFYLGWPHRVSARINSCPIESHSVSEKDQKFHFSFINGGDESYSLAVDISGEPKIYSAVCIAREKDGLIEALACRLYPGEIGPVTKRKLSGEDSRYTELLKDVSGAVRKNPNLARYCPKELLPR